MRLKPTEMLAGQCESLQPLGWRMQRLVFAGFSFKYCLTAAIPISWIDLGEEPHQKNFPWVKLSSWAQHLLDTGLLPRVLVGVNDFATMKIVLTEFWSRYEEMDAGHPVFALERNGIVCRDRLVPFLFAQR